MKRILTLTVLILVLLSSCGQPAATQAPADTPVPPPTETPLPPTPEPLSLTVLVTDESGAPIPGAEIIFPEAGAYVPVQADQSGTFKWTDLKRETASLKILAPGYFPTEQVVTLQPGLNEASIALKFDPFSLLPSAACGTGETLLYMEDFQDGDAQNWRNGDPASAASMYVAPAPDDAANSVFIFDASKMTPGPDAFLGANYAGVPSPFGDVVWRVRFMVNKVTAPTFNWHEAGPSEFGGQAVDATRYAFNFSSSSIDLRRTLFGLPGPLWDQSVDKGAFTQIPETWHWVEISSFQNHLQIWMDGKLRAQYQDPQPLPNGSIGIWLGPIAEASTTMLYFDNMSVCGLSAPFTSMITPAP